MKYVIRRVDTKIDQMQQLLKLLQRTCLPSDTVVDPRNGHWWVVFVEGGPPVGFAGMVASTRWTDCMYLCRAGVMNAHTGNGLQARLIKARVAYAKRLQMNWVVTDTYNNPPSANSLINCGFKLFDPAVPWAGKGSLFWRYRIRHAD